VQIPLSSPDITDLEKRAVLDVLSTPHLAMGPKLEEFEKRLAAYHERRFSVAVNSGTSALHLAMLAVDLRPGDEVITTPFSFIASTNCILYGGGVPRFVDIDPQTWNLDARLLETVLTPRTKGILPVHVFGLPCEMERINAFARTHGLWVIEDACEAIGARDGQGVVGKCADVSVLAFYPNKQITTGEGGALLTDRDRVARLCRSWRNQGRDDFRHNGSCHQRLGFNYRLSDIAAALGLAQLGRIDEILAKRSRVADFYDERLSACEWLRPQSIPPGTTKSWFVYVVALAGSFEPGDRDRILQDLRRRGIGCSDYFASIHRQPHVQSVLPVAPLSFPVCEALSERTIALPFHANLTAAEVDYVCDALLEAGEKVLARRGLPLLEKAAS
jgi:perosamine synthetase